MLDESGKRHEISFTTDNAVTIDRIVITPYSKENAPYHFQLFKVDENENRELIYEANLSDPLYTPE